VTIPLDPDAVSIAPAGTRPDTPDAWTRIGVGAGGVLELLHADGRVTPVRVIRHRHPACQGTIDAVKAYAQRQRIGRLLEYALLDQIRPPSVFHPLFSARR
jgi:hypothetical protein